MRVFPHFLSPHQNVCLMRTIKALQRLHCVVVYVRNLEVFTSFRGKNRINLLFQDVKMLTKEKSVQA